MDRSFLYGIIVLLALTESIIYIQKTDPGLIAKLLPFKEGDDGWKSTEPGWEAKPGDEKKDNKPEPEKPAPDKKNELVPGEGKADENGKCRPFRFWNRSRN